MIDWDGLRIFLQIARSGSVLGAARELRLDHSTVSRRLAALEQAMRVRLFNRAGRRLGITERGETLRRAVEQMEAVYLREIVPIPADIGEIAGRVRLGAPEGLGAGYLGGLIGRIATHHPELELELVALPQDYSLASREVDIAITLDRPATGNVFVRKLIDYTLLLYASRDYIARHGAPASVEALREHVLCGYIPEMLHTDELAYRELPQLAAGRIRSTSILAQRDMVESGHAVGVLPMFLARGNRDLVPVLADRIRIGRSYWISIHDDLRMASRFGTVIELVKESVLADRALFAPEADVSP